MYTTSPGHRYARYSNQAQSYSPTKGYAGYASSSSDARQHYYSPPLKAQQMRSYGSDYYGNNNNSSSSSASSSAAFYAQESGTTYYHSSSSTASSSQDGYYGDDLDDFEELRSAFSSMRHPDADPEMTTVPTVPTPLALSLYEVTKTPSGRVLVTSSNQTIEFFSCAVNAPARCVYVAE